MRYSEENKYAFPSCFHDLDTFNRILSTMNERNGYVVVAEPVELTNTSLKVSLCVSPVFDLRVQNIIYVSFIENRIPNSDQMAESLSACLEIYLH